MSTEVICAEAETNSNDKLFARVYTCEITSGASRHSQKQQIYSSQ